ncbi:Large T-antigen [Thetapolyomavirus trepennellii]|uniref:DNA 3'-5' helicase n=1 Tax=Thetapolyomavirus trepennellii TaxID=2170103 RepID=A0A0E3JRJ3_9POLY|nr:Large T-antigen [Thetapolyomavirus trepennellii]AJZ72666.1 Large T-antigen [Thetapolyomavirus trepennellii]
MQQEYTADANGRNRNLLETNKEVAMANSTTFTSNVYASKLIKALGSSVFPGATMEDNMITWNADMDALSFQDSQGNKEDRILLREKVNDLWKGYQAAEAVLADFAPSDTPKMAGPVDFCADVTEFLDPDCTSASAYLFMAPASLYPQLMRIAKGYRLDDYYGVAHTDEKWGEIQYFGFKTRYRLARHNMLRKMEASVSNKGWVKGCPVVSKKFNMCKSHLFNCAGAEVTEGAVEFDVLCFNQQTLARYAKDTGTCDPLLLMGDYMAFSGLVHACTQCHTERRRGGQCHATYHKEHQGNAKAFMMVSNKKSAATNACDESCAVLRRASKLPRYDRLKDNMDIAMKVLEESDITNSQVAAAMLLSELIPGSVCDFFDQVISALLKAEPKKQGFIFRGPYNTGKSTVAAAVMSLLGGSSLNVNSPRERLWVEFGLAMDRFAVCFEDVQGIPSPGEPCLPFGEGWSNLDHFREYLDGLFKVGLEKKHQNKVTQNFPPWIATTNNYIIPESVLERAVVIPFKRMSFDVQKYIEEFDVDLRFLSSGPCLFLLWLLEDSVDDIDDELLDRAVVLSLAAKMIWNAEMRDFIKAPPPDVLTAVYVAEDGGIRCTTGPEKENTPFTVSKVWRAIEKEEEQLPEDIHWTDSESDSVKSVLATPLPFTPPDPGLGSSDEEEEVPPRQIPKKRKCPFIDEAATECADDEQSDSSEPYPVPFEKKKGPRVWVVVREDGAIGDIENGPAPPPDEQSTSGFTDASGTTDKDDPDVETS